MTGQITTHVLDTAQGKPAAGVAIQLCRLAPDGRAKLVRELVTNADGRASEPLLSGGEMMVGRYELVFAIGPYFARQSVAVSEPPFLDRIPVRFTVTDPAAHYHIPLLVSPWAYSTYRGS